MGVLDTGSATVMESVSHTLRAGGVPNVDTFDLILGNYAGPIGATSVLILVACAMYLWMRRDITLGIPFGFLLSCALVAFFYPRVNTLGLELPWQYLDIRLLSLKYEMLSGALFTAGQPDPDLIIRPSGEERLSNFLLWQSAYAEFVSFDILWPDFKPKHLDAAIEKYQSRSRRFGGV